ncbi:MAG: GNAT family N-acetyltransferase [Rhodobacteraceae bacterium]|nr:GNAT family N-acetyltransferase [Paracoccaceae bacterium]
MTVTISETRDLATCLAIRRIVFTLGQGVSPEDEVDGRDPEALHLLAHRNLVPVGTARMLIDGGTGKIGRVAVLAEARGEGLGRALVLAALDVLRREGCTRAVLGSQTHAMGFYERLGFRAFGEQYLDAGIAHRDMERSL